MIMASNLLGESTQEDGWVVCRVFRKKNYHRSLESPQSSSMISRDSRTQLHNSSNDCVLDRIIHYMGKSCTQPHETASNMNSDNNIHHFANPINTAISDGVNPRFLHLPRLESPTIPSLPYNNSHFNQDGSNACGHSVDDMLEETEPSYTIQGNDSNMDMVDDPKDGLSNWALDHLVASQLNGEVETSKQQSLYGDPNEDFCITLDHYVQSPHPRLNRPQQVSQIYSSEIDLWSFARSSSSSSSDPLFHLSV
ncbi:unnamed protein product [Ilex paraguariensis]|uniref:NAC domain-containing protein n=1 Tax=Ilex paraguariensis TaxID=185542 RepID=A0ABC8UTM6_9AQUA